MSEEAARPASVEAIWSALRNRSISLVRAFEIVGSPTLDPPFDLTAARIFTEKAFDLAQRGEYRDAIDLQRLLIAAADALPPGTKTPQMDWYVHMALIRTVHSALITMPVENDYDCALRSARRMTSIICVFDRPAEQFGKIAFALGVLHLDPYVVGYKLENRTRYTETMRRWRERAVQQIDDDSKPSASRASLPDAEMALTLADAYLRASLPCLSGDEKGSALKALLETIQWRHGLFDVAIDANEIDDFISEARKCIDPVTMVETYLEFLNLTHFFGKRIDPAELRALVKPSFHDIAQQLGPARARNFAIELLTMWGNIDPRYALRIVDETREAIACGDVARRSDETKLELDIITRAVATAIRERFTENSSVIEHLAWLEAQTSDDDTIMAAAYLYLANSSIRRSLETEGQACLTRLVHRFPTFVSQYRDVFSLLTIWLSVSQAADAYERENWPQSIVFYATAVRLSLIAGFIEDAFGQLDDIADIARYRGTEDALVTTIRMLSIIGPSFQAIVGDRAQVALVDLYDNLINRLDKENMPVEALLVAFEGAKGSRFATEVLRGRKVDVRDDRVARQMLTEIDDTAREVHIEPTSDLYDTRIDDEVLLTSYVRTTDRSPGATAAQRLENLQHRFDAYVVSQRLEPNFIDGDVPLDLVALQSELDDQTVLVNIYYTNDVDRSVMAIILAITNDDVKHYTSTIRGWTISAIVDHDLVHAVRMPPIALIVQALRRKVVLFTGMGVVDRDAGRRLAEDGPTFFGNLVDQLERWHAAGKRHLRIIPHGALHYYPLHLIGAENTPLADKWLVSYLPNLRLLRPAPIRKQAEKLVVTAIGLSFLNEPSLPALPGSVDEATAIAKIFNAAPFLDADATKSRVIEAFLISRYVHISTHGKHNVAAPSFQCIYVSGKLGPETLCAYELAALDLRHLDVVTLSACETALGRFDYGDNMRGLSAALLLAGVGAIVGTLWNVFADSTEVFFPEFYRRLAAGDRTRDAFRFAQIECRRQNPQYNAWGAFYLVDRNS